MAAYNAQGVTAVYEAHNMRFSHIRAYKDLHAAGRPSAPRLSLSFIRS